MYVAIILGYKGDLIKTDNHCNDFALWKLYAVQIIL